MKAWFYGCAGVLLLTLAFALGAETVRAQSAGGPEVAVLAGVVGFDGKIPLPLYADGVEALESECHVIVSPAGASFGSCYDARRTIGKCLSFSCTTNGLSAVGNTITAMSDGLIIYGTMSASYMIVAVRNSGVTQVARHSMGQIKDRWR